MTTNMLSHKSSAVCDAKYTVNLRMNQSLKCDVQAHLLQGHIRHRPPLMVHVCTSSQNPLTTGHFFQHVQTYFSSHPPPFRVILGPYPKYQGFNIVSSSQVRAVRSAMAEAKIVVLCGLLRAAGRERLAKKLYSGWKVSHAAHCCVTMIEVYTLSGTCTRAMHPTTSPVC